MRAVVAGMIATYPVGGVAWDYGQYLLGLEALGFETYYIEDTGNVTYDPVRQTADDDASYGVNFLASALRRFSPSLDSRWHFRSRNGAHYGMPVEEVNQLFRSCDIFLNVSGGTLLRDTYLRAKRKVLLDTDPGWNHFLNFPRWDANPGWQQTAGYRAHDHFFTYAACIQKRGCRLPDMGLKWFPTRPPVALEKWGNHVIGDRWTTVMTWDTYRHPLKHDGLSYGSKELEFPKIENLPTAVPFRLEIAAGGKDPPRERWLDIGWEVVDSETISRTPDLYRDYIIGSRGEISVAKNVYVATHSGWFSCRSTCYLAAGRPVIVQDTGFSEIIPSGEGLLTFTNFEEAAEAFRRVESDYPRHQAAARKIAEEHFSADIVLTDMLTRVGVG